MLRGPLLRTPRPGSNPGSQHSSSHNQTGSCHLVGSGPFEACVLGSYDRPQFENAAESYEQQPELLVSKFGSNFDVGRAALKAIQVGIFEFEQRLEFVG